MENRERIINQITKELNLSNKSIVNVIQLFEDGNTIPFIARYRKESTGGLDEVQIHSILEKWEYAGNLEKRKEEVLRLIDEQGKLTEELKQQIQIATMLQQVEDLYRPYKQKRRTKATVAKEKGLEPLAEWMFSLPQSGDINDKATEFLNEQVETIEDALNGAKDIIAEWVSDDAKIRDHIRKSTFDKGVLVSTRKDDAEDEKNVYEMYYEYEEQIKRIVPHRVLAVNRGEKEEILRVSITAPTEELINAIQKMILKGKTTIVESYLLEVFEDAYKRLIQPSIEREIRNELTEKAEDRAIHIFAENLRSILLQPPLKGKTVLGVDPAYRTGCKLSVVDETGKMLAKDVIYPHPPKADPVTSKEKFIKMINEWKVEVIAIGNGTASRETEQFVADVIKELDDSIYYLIVNEAGASVYSASALAREEFPNLEVEERSAVSIARRLQDPLAELVKIDPKSVGVGQYQHDVSQKKLNESLGFVVETVVNQVGVNVNTASSSLLQYVSGLTKTAAQNIVKLREEQGKFTNRSQLKKVPRLGAKTYEQCIGFLRILDGDRPLDRTGIHPESYNEVKQMLKSLGMSEHNLGTNELREKIEQLDIKASANELNIGELTLKDIIDALIRPERDPRDDLSKPLLKKDILKIDDVKKGMQFEGTVRNVVDFGAFIDIGLKEDGLVHISKMSTQYVKHPMDIVAAGQIVNVWVDDIDLKRGRVSLTLINPAN